MFRAEVYGRFDASQRPAQPPQRGYLLFLRAAGIAVRRLTPAEPANEVITDFGVQSAVITDPQPSQANVLPPVPASRTGIS